MRAQFSVMSNYWRCEVCRLPSTEVGTRRGGVQRLPGAEVDVVTGDEFDLSIDDEVYRLIYC